MADQRQKESLLQALQSRGHAPSHEEVVERIDSRLHRRRRARFGTGVALAALAIAAVGVVVASNEPSSDLNVFGNPTTSTSNPSDEGTSTTSSVDAAPGEGVVPSAVWRTYEPAPPAASLNFAGSAATDRHVLVWGNSDFIDSGAVLDLETGGWIETPPAPISARSGPTVAAAGTGFLVIGGTNNGRLGDAAFFDPDRNAWEEVDDFPIDNPGLYVRSALSLTNGTVAVVVDEKKSTDVGALDFVQRTASVFDPQNGSWSDAVDVPTSETNITIAEDQGGKLVVVSTSTPTVEELPAPQVSGIFRLDPLTGEWAEIRATTPASLVTAVDVDADGNILVAGGESIHLVDPTAGSVVSTDGPFQFNACTQQGSFVEGLGIVVRSCTLQIAHLTESDLDQAVRLAPAPIASSGNSSYVVGDTIIFVGADGDRVSVITATIQPGQPPTQPSQDPNTDTTTGLAPGWEPLGSIPANDIDLVAVSDHMVVVGSTSGVTTIDNDGTVRMGAAGPLDSTECCDPPFLPIVADDDVIAVSRRSGTAHSLDLETLTWTEFPSPPVDGEVLDVAWTGREVIVVVTTSDVLSTQNQTHVVALDPNAGTWRQLPTPPQPINRGGVATLDDRIVLSGTVQGLGNVVIGDREPYVFELLDDEWTTIEPPPIDGQAAVALPLADGFVAWNYVLDAAVSDGRGWRPAADLPGPDLECTPDGYWTVAGVTTNGCGGLAVFDDDRASWTQIRVTEIPDRFHYWTVGYDRVVLLDTIDPELVTVYEYQLEPAE